MAQTRDRTHYAQGPIRNELCEITQSKGSF